MTREYSCPNCGREVVRCFVQEDASGREFTFDEEIRDCTCDIEFDEGLGEYYVPGE